MKKLLSIPFILCIFIQSNFAQTYTGNASFSSQSTVNAFGTYTSITGNLTITGPDIVNLSKLNTVESIGGNLFIKGTRLTDLSGLKNVKRVGGNIQISEVPELLSIGHFTKMTDLAGPLLIFKNPKLTTIGNWDLLARALNVIQIRENPSLTYIDFSHLTNAQLIEIYRNDALSGVSFTSLRTVDSEFRLAYNKNLSSCCSLLGFVKHGSAGSLAIWENKTGCDDIAQINQCNGQTYSTDITSIGMTPWEVHEGHDGVINFQTRQMDQGTLITTLPYDNISIPDNDDLDWRRAGIRNGKIFYERPSVITNSEGGKKVDFTYFQTHVFIPDSVTITSFQVSMDRADDGARIYLKNSKHFTNAHFNSDHDLVYKDHPTEVIELKDEIVKGEDNRIVIALYDDNPGTIRADGIHIKINGEEVPLHSSNNTALHFDGSSDKIETQGNPDFFKESFTIEGWIKPDQDARTGAIFNIFKDRGTAIYAEVMQGGVNDGKLRVIYRYNVGASGGFGIISDVSVRDGKWHHIALVKGDDDKITLYIDGENPKTAPQIARDFNQSPELSQLQLRIGMNVEGSGRHFKGAMDEIRCWSVARSQTDIKRWMHKPLNGNEPGLDIYYDFNEGISEADNSTIQSVINQAQPPHLGTLDGFDLTTHQSNFVHSLPIY